MAAELEYSEDSHQSNHSKDGQGHCLVLAILIRHHRRLWSNLFLLFCYNGGQGDEVGDDGHQVYHVHDVSAKLHFTGAG